MRARRLALLVADTRLLLPVWEATEGVGGGEAVLGECCLSDEERLCADASPTALVGELAAEAVSVRSIWPWSPALAAGSLTGELRAELATADCMVASDAVSSCTSTCVCVCARARVRVCVCVCVCVCVRVLVCYII